MQTALALILLAALSGGSWWIYVSTGARRWTMERDPLGEPPVRTAALIGAIVLAIALASSGGGDAERAGSAQQGLSDGDLGLPGGAFAGSAGDPLAASRSQATATAPPMRLAAAPTGADADEPAKAVSRPEGTPPPRSTTRTRTAGPRLPAYGRLVVRARKAAERRGAHSTWYPSVAERAERASRRRGRPR